MYIDTKDSDSTGRICLNANKADKLATARTITIGNTGKSFNGTANVSWTLAEIGALSLTGGTMSGDIAFKTIATWPTEEGETYPIISKGLYWSGSSDFAKMFFRVTGSDKGQLVMQMGDSTDEVVVIENNAGINYATIGNGGIAATNFYGNASSASKLQTARTIRTNLASTSTASFDGSANITPGITGVLGIGNGGTGANNRKTAITNLGIFGLYERADIGTSPNFDNPGVNGFFELRTKTETTGETGTKPYDGFGPFISIKYSNTMFQLAGTNTNGFYIRGKQAANVTLSGVAWQKLLTSGNYTDYTVTKTGTGASGTWGISITGNAATATKATQDGSGNTITSKYVTLDTAQTISGKKTFSNQIIFSNTADSDAATANSGVVLIGNPAAEHISIDGNEIMAKATGTTTGTLNLQANNGGPTYIGGTLTVVGNAVFQGNIAPAANNNKTLGTSSYKWNNVYATTFTGNLSGNATTATKLQTARTITIGATGKTFDGSANISWTPYEMRVTRAQYGADTSMNEIADNGCELGMANLSSTDTTINPGGGTSWHHYINMTWSDAKDNNGSTTNEWCTQIANKCGTTDLWVRSRGGGKIVNGTAWVAPWTRILTGSNYANVLDGRYVNVSGDTMTGHLNATAGLSWNHANWAPSGNISCTPTANGQEWSIDVGSSSYTGSMWHVWSTKLNASMLACYADNRHIEIPVHLYVGGYNNTSYALSTSSFICQSWIRTTGSTGWYNESHGGGWYMTDSNYVRTYNSKPIHLNNSVYIGTTSGAGTGLSLYGTSSPDSYGIHMSLTSKYGTHGVVTGDWANYFCFDGTTTRGWIFRQAGTNVASIGGTGNMALNGQLRTAAYKGGAWVNGRDNALVRTTASVSSSSFAPVISAKTQLGSWDVGPCNPMENFYFSYVSDTNYNAGTNTSNTTVYINNSGKIYGAVWNDYAEYRNQKEEIKPGYCVTATDDGKVYKTTTRLQPCDGVVSDTFGFAIGETDECKTPLAVAGRVLVYCAGNRNDYHFGDCVCAGPNGLAYKMTDEEIRNYPHRIIGTISEIPNYEVWGSGNIEVNGRIWIKVK